MINFFLTIRRFELVSLLLYLSIDFHSFDNRKKIEIFRSVYFIWMFIIIIFFAFVTKDIDIVTHVTKNRRMY